MIPTLPSLLLPMQLVLMLGFDPPHSPPAYSIVVLFSLPFNFFVHLGVWLFRAFSSLTVDLEF